MYKEINSFLILFITIYLNTKAVSSSYSYDACTTNGSISSLIWPQNGNEHESGKEAILKCNFLMQQMINAEDNVWDAYVKILMHEHTAIELSQISTICL